MPENAKDKHTEEVAVEELVRLCYAPLFRYARSLAKDEASARDAVQESFLKFLNESKKSKIEHPKAWLFRVCRNKVFDELRRNKKHVAFEEGPARVLEGASNEPGPRKLAELGDGLARLEHITKRLAEREREIVRLKFQGGFSYAEMAQITSLSESNVGVILHNALKNLRGMFFDEANKELKHS